MNKHMIASCIIATAALTSGASADVDFESFDLGGQDFLDTAETLLFSNVAPGVDMTINGGADLRVYDLLEWAGSDPGNNGQAMIDWNWDSQTNDNGTEFIFSTAIDGFSMDAGDFGGDSDTFLMITAYDADNNIVDTHAVEWGDGAAPPFATLSVVGSDIVRVVYESGGAFPGSTFFDNIDVVTIPAPGALALLGSAMILGTRRRRG